MSRDFIFRVKKGEGLPPIDPSGSRILFNEEKQSFEILNNNGIVSNFISPGTSSGGTIPELISYVTYSELVNLINSSSLGVGSYYLITDFQTCYDVPEYYVNGNSKGGSSVDYRQGAVEPIMVLATSINTISSSAFQPAYPKDRIQYDWTWSSTEITGGDAYGRISERIDEFNNRTDYDHRNILFNRFQSYDKNTKLTGVITALETLPGDTLIGSNTLFLNEVSSGDVLIIDQGGSELGVRVSEVLSDSQLTIVTDPTFDSPFCGTSYSFYNTTSTGNFNEYKEVYIGQKRMEDWNSYPTFNLNGSAIHNYVGDYSKFYLQENGSTSGFLLANNVFYSDNSRIYSNTVGDRSYNNTGRYWFLRNTIAGRFYNNTTHNNGFYSNTISEYFDNNIIKSQMYGNEIGQSFESNVIYSQFYNNIISNGFNGNMVYSEFYENQIGVYFEDNIIGDFGNLDNFSFYRNKIGNNFQNNNVNGDFYKNFIGNGFNDNSNIGYNFYGNHIGNAFNNNELIGDFFNNNQIGEYFENNSISYSFQNNQINNEFQNNTLGDTQYFSWDNTNFDNLTARTYNTFYNSLYGNNGENIGNVILGKELIMHFSRDSGSTVTGGNLVIGETYEITNFQNGDDFTDIASVISGEINTNGCIFIAIGITPNSWSFETQLTELTSYDEYYMFKFTQWTQNNNGGGLSYERTKVYPSVESTVYFTKTNYSNSIDVIIKDRLEIKRANNGAIYNYAVEGNYNSNISPLGTEWNSIYTQDYNGSGFEDNSILNQFKGNYIRQQFSLNNVNSYVSGNHFSGYTQNNDIGAYTFVNDFSGDLYGNSWKGDFYSNIFRGNFQGNSFGHGTYNNVVGANFYLNKIENSFNNNTIGDNFGFGSYLPQGNRIGNNFYNNNIGEYFYNNTIPDNFQNNYAYDYFQWNVVNTNIDSVNFMINYGNILNITYQMLGSTTSDKLYSQLFGITNGHGIEASFDVDVSGGSAIMVSASTIGILYNTGDTITIPGTQIGGVTGVVNEFSNNGIGLEGVDGVYSNIFAQGSGSGEGASFDITVVDGLVESVVLNQGGGSYLVGEVLIIDGSVFGGTNNIIISISSVYSDDIIITVTEVSPTPSVYETYTCQIFEKQGGEKRLSFYDENDILTIKNTNE